MKKANSKFFSLQAVFALLLVVSCSEVLQAQKPAIIKITDLTKRIEANNDTTYVVNFWATWCVPCVQELPDLEELNKKYAGTKVKVLLVSLDFSEDHDKKLIPFLKNKNILSEVVLLDEVNGNYFIPLVDDRWTGSLPCTFIINNSKKVKECYEKKITFEFLEERLKEIKP